MNSIITTYSQAASYLESIYDLLNEEFFESALSKVTITIMSSPKTYGSFSLRDDTWVSAIGGTHELNVSAGALGRPIVNVCCTLLHEMTHFFCLVNGIQDCSRSGSYHNRNFKTAAEQHGLIIEKHNTYGWTITKPSPSLEAFVERHELTDILLNRNDFCPVSVPVSGGTSNGAAFTTTRKPSSTRKYICPCCGMSVRATRNVNIGCWDCDEQMVVSA